MSEQRTRETNTKRALESSDETTDKKTRERVTTTEICIHTKRNLGMFKATQLFVIDFSPESIFVFHEHSLNVIDGFKKLPTTQQILTQRNKCLALMQTNN